jgi:thioredoxin reductase (NADPH)
MEDGGVRDITVIGAGPVGLIAAFWAGMREASVRIVDSLPEIGGQLTALYPEKWIYDVPGLPRVRASDLVGALQEQSLGQFDVPLHLSTTVSHVEYEGDVLRLVTDSGDLLTRTLIVAGGHGAFEPKKLPGYDMSPWEGRGAFYVVGEKAEFDGRRVVIVGGGDSALDWTLNLVGTAAEVTLVHRRERFRGHPATVRAVQDAAAAGKVSVMVPYQVRLVEGNGRVESVALARSDDPTDVVTLPCDAVLLQLGFKTALGPLASWPLEIEKGSIVVDQVMKTSMDAVWAAGDVTTFDGKLKLIATGFGEAAVAVAQAVRHIRPEERIQPAYSTNTGVPGVVEGQV